MRINNRMTGAFSNLSPEFDIAGDDNLMAQIRFHWQRLLSRDPAKLRRLWGSWAADKRAFLRAALGKKASPAAASPDTSLQGLAERAMDLALDGAQQQGGSTLEAKMARILARRRGK